MRRTRWGRWVSVAAAGVVIAGTQFGVQVLTVGTAEATPGLEVVVAKSTYDSDPGKVTVASCPGDKRVVGGGARILRGEGRVAISTMFPSQQAYTAAAAERAGGFGQTWALWAYAVCISKSAADQMELEIVGASSSEPIGSKHKGATVSCGARGKVVVGLGGAVNLYANQGLALRGLTVNAATAEVSVTGADDLRDRLTVPSTFSVSAWAVCARRPLGYEVVTKSSPITDSESSGHRVNCPNGKATLGMGGMTVEPALSAYLDYFFQREDAKVALIHAHRVGSTDGWYFVTQAICAY
jgi:hypothetical protein